MSTTIDVSVVPTRQNSHSEKCHFIPCDINFDGEANVSDFFNTTISRSTEAEQQTETETLTAVFRGRPLKGIEISIPSGYTGIVVKDPVTRTTDDEDRCIIATHSFDRFNFWNLDKVPTSDDLLQKGFQWVDIASALHRPIVDDTTEDLSQRSIKGQ
nr:ribonuclease H2 subunit C-like [Biomphalaria glabrata]